MSFKVLYTTNSHDNVYFKKTIAIYETMDEAVNYTKDNKNTPGYYEIVECDPPVFHAHSIPQLNPVYELASEVWSPIKDSLFQLFIEKDRKTMLISRLGSNVILKCRLSEENDYDFIIEPYNPTACKLSAKICRIK